MNQRYRPNVTVACVIHCQGHFLLVEEEINGQRCVNQPAGHLEANESLLCACQREVREETGLTVMPDKLLGIYQFSAPDGLAFLRFTYLAELPQMQAPTPQDSQINAAHWLTIEQIRAITASHRSVLVMQSINDYLAGKGTDLNLINADFL